NTSSAEKRIRQERKRTAHNRAQRSRLKTALKRVSSATEAGAAQEALGEVSALLDRLATRRIIHPNKAARKKSQLAKKVARMVRA
ncbi:MAG TPA: 30S ribosomal protein S20, partial [Longimicrobiales bacterium]|nr:30S ribosomal protein S20 [Longimicrobiales bacterium]